MNQLGYFKTSELILRMLFILNTRKFMQRHRNNTSTFTYIYCDKRTPTVTIKKKH